MKWYFAYGSNMDSDRLKKRIGSNRVEAKMGWLKGYALTFDKLADNGSGYANVQPVNIETVYGVLYKLTEKELQKLDRCEGVPAPLCAQVYRD